jgi:hypothetical protein
MGLAEFLASYWAQIVAAALAAASTYSNYQGQKEVRRTQERAMLSESQRQRQLQDEADAITRAATSKVGKEGREERREDLEQKTLDYIAPTGAAVQEAEYTQSNPGAPVEIKTDIARRLSEELTKGRDYAARQAKLGSYGRSNLDVGQILSRTAGNLAVPLSFSRSSSALLPYELQSANAAGDNWRTAGDVFGGLSNIASIYGAFGNPGAAPAGGGKNLGTGLVATETNFPNIYDPERALGMKLNRGAPTGFKLY